jgi:hypothetical protein
MLVRLGVIARPARRYHQAALITIALFDHHLAGAGFAGLIALVFLHLAALCM